jgi:multicopper oxidase
MRASFLIYGVLLSIFGFGLHPGLAAERVYYLAADEVLWDYAPSYPDNPVMGEPFSAEESVYLKQGDDRIGRRYLKAIYREYTDGSFSTLKARSPEESHLGILGPILHAEVGDTIVVHFRNNTRLSIGIHPHGLLYDKSSEGAHYRTETAMDPAGMKSLACPRLAPM